MPLIICKLSINNQTPFTFDLHLSRDGLYGARYQSINVQTGELEIRWNGAVGELMREEADLAVAALTINADRDAIIDFSKPWLYHGITIMERQVSS
uniref:Ionotropic glutamate receptor L-glutamate and glycine-binding domain-containing protein n=1 Tax=Romanomermis culicivorax TaxID=13658 RepID=A0A915IQ28_ROMCU